MDRVSRPRLLVVDDEVRWAKRLGRELTERGLDVSVCHDGQSALAAVARSSPDVVLLDARMPGMDGYEACRRLRESGYRGSVLIYSAYDSTSDVVLAHESGADDHVSKAAEIVVLEAKVQRAVRRMSDEAAPRTPGRPPRPSGIRDLIRDLEHVPPIDWSSLSGLDERLLCKLACARAEVVSAKALLLEGWGRADLPVSRLYEPISNLRDKLEPLGWTIRNARRHGYALVKVAHSENARRSPVQ